MEEVVDGFRGRFIHAWRMGEIVERGALDRLQGAEMQEKRAFAARADTADLVERALHELA